MTFPQVPQSLSYDAAAYRWMRDLDHLNLLGIFHYIFGGLVLAASCLCIIYIVIGILGVRGAFPADNHGEPFPPEVGWMFIAIGSVAMLVGWTVGILVIYSGRCIRSRRHWVFSLIMAGVICISVPLGTVLGVFTFIVLLRESVKPIYARSAAANYRPAWGQV
jgi:hypothetical protein